MNNIPENFKDLLKDETKAFAFLGTIMPDGSPQVTPVWFNTEGDYILINSAEGRRKDRNMRARRQVAVTLMNPANPYRYLEVRGEVVDITSEGGTAHIHALSHKYHGEDYKLPEGQVRVIYKIKPLKTSSMG
ncbi:MAG: PPOX class F420-dependent oxidoreductase [Anaerolineales bacterium]|nr:PPOX class F420-dependent oxidoreductase [Anaerolineales bacterium]